MVHTDTIPLSTRGFADIIDITEKVAAIASTSGVSNGIERWTPGIGQSYKV
jgi:thiamine phosphate synthase YjbQ (UPF0047 family)